MWTVTKIYGLIWQFCLCYFTIYVLNSKLVNIFEKFKILSQIPVIRTEHTKGGGPFFLQIKKHPQEDTREKS